MKYCVAVSVFWKLQKHVQFAKMTTLEDEPQHWCAEKKRAPLFARYGVNAKKSHAKSENSVIDTGVSQGKLREVLEKMHEGEVVPQPDVATALREFNHLQEKLTHLQQKLGDIRKNQTDHAETNAIHPNFDDPKKAIVGTVTGGYLRTIQNENFENKHDREQKFVEELHRRLTELTTANASTLKPSTDILVSDLAPPPKLIKDFLELYAKEWSLAFNELKTAISDEQKALQTLFKVIQYAYVFCQEVAEFQKTTVEGLSDKLQETLLHPTFVHPVTNQIHQAKSSLDAETKKHIEVGRKLILEYRNILVTRTAQGVQQLFQKVKLPEILDRDNITTSIRDFTEKLVPMLWLMVVQDPPMVLFWSEPGRVVITDYFNYYDRNGSFVSTTVWPAVFRKQGGDLLSRGAVKTKATRT